jgi:putative tryptophan/tyrosine transport system substrate-binding protein
MRRREFISLVSGIAVTWPLFARAQPPTKVFRIGFLGLGTPAAWANRIEALRGGLRTLGYVEGENLVIEFRWTETIEQLRERATELVRMDVDVIFATSSTEVEAARQATNTVPIVFATHADPVGLGHVSSLPRPGGNITGLSGLGSDIAAKTLELFKETVPRATRFGAFWSPSAPWHRTFLQDAEAASAKLGTKLYALPIRTVEDFEEAFARVVREHIDGVFIMPTSLSRSQRIPLAKLALKYRLPSMFGAKENVEVGGLMSYAADYVDLTRRAATYIDKILKGAKPADLPVEQASKYLLVINLKTAKALGLAIPPAVLALADEVIE